MNVKLFFEMLKFIVNPLILQTISYFSLIIDRDYLSTSFPLDGTSRLGKVIVLTVYIAICIKKSLTS
jgi:hypothetical protein